MTIERKISHLKAAVNIAIDDGKFSGTNPFAKVVGRAGLDRVRRQPLSEADMSLVRSHLHELSQEDRLLWVWLATTGMRLSEPFQVVEEHEEGGIRYTIIGSKTASNHRRVPIPEAVAALHPKKIDGVVFSESPETHAKRLRYFLRRLGISKDAKRDTGDERKTLHSLRHRAADRLRAVQCPVDVRLSLLSHERIAVARKDGRGYPVRLLREWQASIGY